MALLGYLLGALAGLYILSLFVLKPQKFFFVALVVTLLYPQNLLLGLLPLNMGLDDLLLILAFLRSLSTGLTPEQELYPARYRVLWIVAGVFTVFLVANLTGTLEYPVLKTATLKASLKGLIYLSVLLSARKLIRTTEDIRRFLNMMAWGSLLAGIVVVLTYISPAIQHLFDVPKGLDLLLGRDVASTPQEGRYRAFGAFIASDALGAYVCMFFPILAYILYSRDGGIRFFHRWLYRAAMAAILISLLLTKSRSAIVGLAGMGTMLLLFSKQRRLIVWFGLATIVIIALLTIVLPEALPSFTERFDETVFSEGIAVRMAIFRKTISEISTDALLCGQGTYVFLLEGRVPHNSFLDAFFIWGVGGLIAFSALYGYALLGARRAWKISGGRRSLLGCYAIGFFWSVIATFFFGMSADLWLIPNYLLFLPVLLHCLDQSLVILRSDVDWEYWREQESGRALPTH